MLTECPLFHVMSRHHYCVFNARFVGSGNFFRWRLTSCSRYCFWVSSFVSAPLKAWMRATPLSAQSFTTLRSLTFALKDWKVASLDHSDGCMAKNTFASPSPFKDRRLNSFRGFFCDIIFQGCEVVETLLLNSPVYSVLIGWSGEIFHYSNFGRFIQAIIEESKCDKVLWYIPEMTRKCRDGCMIVCWG